MCDLFYKQYKNDLDLFIKNAISEDIQSGDISSMACIPTNSLKSAKLDVKESCIIAGIQLVEKILNFYDSDIKFKKLISDGSKVNKGSVPFLIEGNARSILAIERIILNTLQRMSGIATITNSLVKKVESFDTIILDTRKTTPNFRYPEKWAVKIGGGENHRMGLFDTILIKDNHIDYSNDLNTVLNKIGSFIKKLEQKPIIIVEVRNILEIKIVLKFSFVDRILLDNMNVSQLYDAVSIINGIVKTEASGEINEHNIEEVARTGVDYISIGALTHSAPHIDLSLKAC